jgi:rRNA-processing protein Efg1
VDGSPQGTDMFVKNQVIWLRFCKWRHKSMAESSRLRGHNKRSGNRGSSTNATPGVQKIRSSLRQTRRLLSKVRECASTRCCYERLVQDNLAADVRVEAERKQKALEADLALAEASRKEAALAKRYHKVKFFGESTLRCITVEVIKDYKYLCREAESHSSTEPNQKTSERLHVIIREEAIGKYSY